MEIKNITIAEYLTIEDRAIYDALFKYAEDSKDIFSIGDFTLLTFGQIKELQYKYSKGVTIKDIIEFISLVKSIEFKVIGQTRILDFIKANNFIKKQIEFINSIEENALVGSVSADEERADIVRFNKFGYLIQVDKLSGGDITKYETIKSITYMDCFTKLYLDKERIEFNKDLNRITQSHNTAQ